MRSKGGFPGGQEPPQPTPTFPLPLSGCRLSRGTLSSSSNVRSQLPLTLHPEEKTEEWTGTPGSCKQGQLEQAAGIYGKMAGSWDKVDREEEGRPEARGQLDPEAGVLKGIAHGDISRLASVSACRHGCLSSGRTVPAPICEIGPTSEDKRPQGGGQGAGGLG